MFLQATFFTTAGKRSEAFLPLAIICTQNRQTHNQQAEGWKAYATQQKIGCSLFHTLTSVLTRGISDLHKGEFGKTWKSNPREATFCCIPYSPPQCASWPPASGSPCCCPASPSSHHVYKREIEREWKKKHTLRNDLSASRLALLTEPSLITQNSSKKGRPVFFFFPSKCWKFIKVCERDPEMIPFEVRNSPGKIWKALKVRLVKKKKQDNWNVT